MSESVDTKNCGSSDLDKESRTNQKGDEEPSWPDYLVAAQPFRPRERRRATPLPETPKTLEQKWRHGGNPWRALYSQNTEQGSWLNNLSIPSKPCKPAEQSE